MHIFLKEINFSLFLAIDQTDLFYSDYDQGSALKDINFRIPGAD